MNYCGKMWTEKNVFTSTDSLIKNTTRRRVVVIARKIAFWFHLIDAQFLFNKNFFCSIWVNSFKGQGRLNLSGYVFCGKWRKEGVSKWPLRSPHGRRMLQLANLSWIRSSSDFLFWTVPSDLLMSAVDTVFKFANCAFICRAKTGKTADLSSLCNALTWREF